MTRMQGLDGFGQTDAGVGRIWTDGHGGRGGFRANSVLLDGRDRPGKPSRSDVGEHVYKLRKGREKTFDLDRPGSTTQMQQEDPISDSP